MFLPPLPCFIPRDQTRPCRVWVCSAVQGGISDLAGRAVVSRERRWRLQTCKRQSSPVQSSPALSSLRFPLPFHVSNYRGILGTSDPADHIFLTSSRISIYMVWKFMDLDLHDKFRAASMRRCTRTLCIGLTIRSGPKHLRLGIQKFKRLIYY